MANFALPHNNAACCAIQSNHLLPAAGELMSLRHAVMGRTSITTVAETLYIMNGLLNLAANSWINTITVLIWLTTENRTY